MATRILLIEDDLFMREALTLALGTDGFEVRALEHGLALEGVIKQDLPDLIILDLHLGLGPDGVVLTRRHHELQPAPSRLSCVQLLLAARHEVPVDQALLRKGLATEEV